jgi:hypothetical protein
LLALPREIPVTAGREPGFQFWPIFPVDRGNVFSGLIAFSN